MSSETTNIAEQLHLGNTVIVFTKGTSMQPLLIEGKSYVVLKPIERRLKVGDLPIVLRSDGKYVIHRVIAMTDNGCITRGDNCVTRESVKNESILGIVTEIQRKDKTIKVTDKKYRLYVAIWNIIYPIRWLCYKLRGRLKRGK